ncbi:hypothetical protein [Vreelandella titanicae]|uniref:hypothetical protein n=1 Tax=Vreelandella titanicae TaxID=664683 RepID=UPI00114020D1|nr:hypothetical protein [Halomonas titanicae]
MNIHRDKFPRQVIESLYASPRAISLWNLYAKGAILTFLKSVNALFMLSLIWHSVVAIASTNPKAAGIVRRLVNYAWARWLSILLIDQHF